MARKAIENPSSSPPFKCALLFSPTAVGDPFRWFETGEMRELEELPGGANVSTPTAMIWGSKDESVPRFETLFRIFDDNVSWRYVFEGGHELPNPNVAGSIAGAVKMARRAVTQSSREIALKHADNMTQGEHNRKPPIGIARQREHKLGYSNKHVS